MHTRSWLALAIFWMAFANARAEDAALPEEAVCRVCEIRGAGHGAEKVAASREHEGVRYFFCSKDCAALFDAFPEAYQERTLPRPAPNATVVGLDGEKFSLDDLTGKVVLLDFWATWCVPCIKTMPFLDKLNEEWADEGLALWGISMDEKADKVVPKFVQKKKIGYPIALDTTDDPAWHAYSVAVIPAMFLIDAEHRIVAEWHGVVDEDEVRMAVERLLRTDTGP
jgi:thiol-disulfide isomerase/thioredoxin